MPRAGRRFEEGRFYHVYNRVGGGLMPFEEQGLSRAFVDLLRQIVQRDDLDILAWCLLGNHYHLVVRQGPVDMSRPMKTLQQRLTRIRNLRDRVYGCRRRQKPAAFRWMAAELPSSVISQLSSVDPTRIVV